MFTKEVNNMTTLRGIHHVTAISSGAKENYEFFTNILGMRLVKKTVNQDDINTYHLFFADDRGNPGTDITFFDFANIGAHQQGTDDISRTGFRVASDEALDYWVKRFEHYNVSYEPIKELFGKKVLEFEDYDKQQYALFSDENDEGVPAGEPWHKGPVPDEFAIIGLGPIYLTVSSGQLMDQILVNLMKMREVAKEENITLYEMAQGGNGGSVIVIEDSSLPRATQGYGGVHHVAFRVANKEELNQWIEHFDNLNLRNSGFIDRFYFKSLYIRLYPNILFEIATDDPGFIDDIEDYEILGETLALPPHLRQYQKQIEEQVNHFDTVRSNKEFPKEYFN